MRICPNKPAHTKTTRMDRNGQRVFLGLILAQALHSVEEYVTRLYEVFAPTRLVSNLNRHGLSLGFLVFNGALVASGVWCWAIPVRSGWHSALGFVWFWAILELGNGIGHSALALSRGGYFPGVATAPLLLLYGSQTAILLIKSTPVKPGSPSLLC